MEAFPEFIHRNVLHRLPVGMALHPIGNAPYVRRFATERKWVTLLDTPLTLAVSVPPIALTHHATFVVRYWRKQKLVGCYHHPSSYLPQRAIGTIPHFSAAVNVKNKKRGFPRKFMEV